MAMAIQIRTDLSEPETGQSFVPHRPARPEKSEGGRPFKLVSDYEPSGDQPTAISELVAAARQGERDQVLMGVTGSGQNFTLAKTNEALPPPAFLLAPNKTLAAHSMGRFHAFLSHNCVRLFLVVYAS